MKREVNESENSNAMHKIWIICKREISTFFDSLMAYILLVVFLGLSGFFTWLFGSADIFFVGQASLQTFFNIAFWTLFFFIPAVTMRMFAEERSSGTIELLATKPISDFQIVAGKWLSAWLLIVISLLLTLPYYITVANLGNIDHGTVLSGYIALLLISSVYISIGLFTSSITSNQIVAFILALFVAFFFQMLFSQMAPMLPGFLGNLANYLSIGQHFQTMIRGVIDISNVVYLLSLTILGFLLSTATLKRRAWA